MNKIKIWEDVVYNQSALRDIKIIHIADIHFNINTKYQKLVSLGNKINLENPNYILITGDIIDTGEIISNEEKMKELINFFKLITNNKVIVSLGNHDIHSDCHLFFNDLSKIKNLYILDNKEYFDDYIYVSGLTLPSNYYYDKLNRESVMVFKKHLDKYSNLIKDLPQNKIKIAMIHSPIKLTDEKILNSLLEFDLILSGHTHDGMVPDFLKFLFKGNRGIISPYKKLFPKIAKGKIIKEVDNKKITIIITGGVTKLSLKSAKCLSKLNFIYNISINRIIITKKRGKDNE